MSTVVGVQPILSLLQNDDMKNYYRKQLEFDVLQWWERACNHMGLANLGRVALNALTFPVITTVAEGSFRIMKGLLTPDRRFMSHDSQTGYLLAMINGDVNKHIAYWAL